MILIRTRRWVTVIAVAAALAGSASPAFVAASAHATTASPEVPSAPRVSASQDDTLGWWTQVGPYASLGGMDAASANAMAVWDGSLYAAGTIGAFTGSGGCLPQYPPQCIAAFDGSNWNSVGPGLNNTVNALAVADDTLYAGGVFDGTGSQGMFGCSQARRFGRYFSCIGAWNGTSWTPLGFGLNNTVTALASDGDTLYAGGEFTDAGDDSTANHVASWADDTWSALGTGTNGPVNALATDGSTLYAGGSFTNAGAGTDDSNIAAWNGTAWTPLGTGTNGPVNALATDGSTLYAGGSFTNAGGGTDDSNIAAWNGSAWSPLGSGMSGVVNVIAIDHARGLVYAGGGPNGGVNPLVLSVWDTGISAWIPFPQFTYYPCGEWVGWGQVMSVVPDDSAVYIGGNLSVWTCTTWNQATSPQIQANTVAQWTWAPPVGSNALTAGIDDTVTISGTGFIGVPATGGVMIGSTAVPYVRDDSSTITATLPDGVALGTQEITVNGVGGWGNVGTVRVSSSAPGAPTAVAAKAGNAKATVTWTAPASTGGSPITKYTVTAKPGGKTCTWSTGPLSCVVTGLTNGTAYAFTVTATNTAGTGAASTASAKVTPTGAPGAPTAVKGQAGNAKVTVTWTAPASTGGSPITKYTVTAKPGGKTCTWSTGPLSCVVTGLTNGTAYAFTVTATSKLGKGVASGPSATVTPATVPGVPTNVQGDPLTGGAMIVWKAPSSNGGSPITQYTVTASPGGRTCKETTPFSGLLSCKVWGLTKGKGYTFTVTATNTAGTGAASRWWDPPIRPL